MNYDWNQAKAKANAEKHGVDFADAVIALEDDFAVTIPDPDSEDEERFLSLGHGPERPSTRGGVHASGRCDSDHILAQGFQRRAAIL